MRFGTGPVSLSTNNGNIFVQQSTSDLLTSRFTQNSGSGAVTYGLSTADGNITVDNTAAWSSDDNVVFSTAVAAKDIEFTASGTFTARLVVGNTASPSGALNANAVGGYTGSPGDTVDALP